MTEIAPLLRQIDLIADLDLALALRRARRERRQERARKGWRTRRDSDASFARDRNGLGPEGEAARAVRRHGIAHNLLKTRSNPVRLYKRRAG